MNRTEHTHTHNSPTWCWFTCCLFACFCFCFCLTQMRFRQKTHQQIAPHTALASAAGGWPIRYSRDTYVTYVYRTQYSRTPHPGKRVGKRRWRSMKSADIAIFKSVAGRVRAMERPSWSQPSRERQMSRSSAYRENWVQANRAPQPQPSRERT